MKFSKEDDTDSNDDEDDYWCGYCEAETGEKMEVEYLASECPNGHDLSDDWE